MCWNPQDSAHFSKTIDLRVTCLGLLLKWTFFHLSPQKPHKCVVETLRTVLVFLRWSILRGHMPRFTLKMNVFPSYLLRNTRNCVFRPSEQCLFFQVDRFEGSHVYVYSKNECFLIYLLRNPKDVCWNPQNSACFSEMIDLRCHMPGFTQKINIFPSISSKTPEMVCLNHHNNAHFSETINLRGHMSKFTLKMNIFQSISSKTP